MLVLLSDILATFKPQFEVGMSEFELISALKKPPYSVFDTNALSDSLVLFQTHFMLFHVLYHLRKDWRSDGSGELDIGATSIKLSPITIDKKTLSKADPLADYYLDWQHFSSTSERDVNEMIDDFWQAMGGTNISLQADDATLAEAALCLGIADLDSLNLAQLKIQYRKQQHIAHPDKGGSVEEAQKISAAYMVLRKHID